MHCAVRNNDVKVIECLIAADEECLKVRNADNKHPLQLAEEFHNEKIVKFFYDIFNYNYTIPSFEVLYYKYYQTKTNEDKEKVTCNVIEMLYDHIMDQNSMEEQSQE